ncbi:MAG TPA: GNAT family N-acetyltransferase [Acidimicrobiales bacterium]|nr:GNAT family N-acetyltransferase [Acidimicrobiales bacterium]
MTDADLTLRPLARADFPMVVEWLARPHVQEWWGEPLSADGVEAEFGPCVDPGDPTLVFVCEVDGHPVGLAQCYRMADNADYAIAVGIDDGAGIDLLLADAARRGQGLGPRIIAAVAAVAWERYPEISRVLAGPSVHNTRSHRAFEKAGFTAWRQVTVPDEDDDEMIFVLERPTAA